VPAAAGASAATVAAPAGVRVASFAAWAITAGLGCANSVGGHATGWPLPPLAEPAAGAVAGAVAGSSGPGTRPRARPRSVANRPHVAYRKPGALFIARPSTRSTSAGSSGRNVVTEGGCSDRCELIKANAFGRSKGGAPQRSSNAAHAREY